MTTTSYSGPPPTAPPPAAPGGGPSSSPDPEPNPPKQRRRRGPRSLVSKITTFVVALVVVLVTTIATATYFTQRSFLYDQLDGQLATVATGNAGKIVRCFGTGETMCRIGNEERTYKAPELEWIAVLNPGGQARVDITDGESLRAIRLSDAQMSAIEDDPEAFRTITTTDGHQLRVSARVVSTPFGQFTVVSGLATDEVREILATFVSRAILIGAAALVVALLVTTAGVRFSLRRLRRVTVTAQEVATELSPEGAGLDRRVPEDEPDTEVGQLATSFNMMLSAVEAQFAARLESEDRMRQFLADASHELRTPLTSIRGYAELARMQRAVGESNEDNIDRIEFEGTRMSRLVEDLLILARGDGNRDDLPMQQQLVDVSVLVDDAVDGSRAAFPDRPIEAGEIDPDAVVLGDPDQLLRVIRNLINNAAVHTAPERPIRVEAASDERGVTIRVIDGGPGLSPEDAAHVFERFWRADKARTRARGGSGLGMSIVATIVRAHHGTVRFDSTVENGSTVTVWLPPVEQG
ncbi:sensor histidine kinase [Jatrophihabitans fulvus]